MTEEEIYQLWHSKTNNDQRYLRPLRWKQIKETIISNKLASTIEFGSGVSTILFDTLGIEVTSYETDLKFLRFVSTLCSIEVKFIYWDNLFLHNPKHYDISLVDGALPRDMQLIYALALSDYIAIDDYRKDEKAAFGPLLVNYTRINDESTPLAIFTHR